MCQQDTKAVKLFVLALCPVDTLVLLIVIETALVVEQSLTSHQTHYRSYWGRVFTSQITEPTVSKHERKLQTALIGALDDAVLTWQQSL